MQKLMILSEYGYLANQNQSLLAFPLHLLGLYRYGGKEVVGYVEYLLTLLILD